MLAYESYGRAPARGVLLHGFLGSARNLATLARRLCERIPGYGAVALDLPGHGRSPPLAPDAALADLAAPVGALVEAARGRIAAPVDLLGHSLGGRVALRLLADRPDLVRRVVLLDITPGATLGDVMTRRTADVLAAAP